MEEAIGRNEENKIQSVPWTSIKYNMTQAELSSIHFNCEVEFTVE
jgi:hypothetical protein